MPDHQATLKELRAAIGRLQSAPPAKSSGQIETGLAPLDRTLAGGLPKGQMVELVCTPPHSGATTMIVSLLRRRAQLDQWTALIDGGDRFDPQGAGAEALSRLLWLRCHTVRETFQAADLLLRDANLPLVVLDVRGWAVAELRKVPATTWYRFQRIIEPTSLSLLMVTPDALVPCAQVRLELKSEFGLEAMEQETESLIEGCRIETIRQLASSSVSDFSQAG